MKLIKILLTGLLIIGIFSCGEGFFEEMASNDSTETTPVIWKDVNLSNGASLNMDPTNSITNPKLFTNETDLYIIWEENQDLYLRKYNNNDNEPNWGNDVNIGNVSGNQSCTTAIVFNDIAYIARQDVDSKLKVTRWNLNNNTSMGVDTPGNQPGDQPVFFILENNIFLAYHEITADKIYVYTKEKGNPGWISVANGVDGYDGIHEADGNYSHPQLAAKDEQLYISFQDATNKKIKIRYFDYPATSTWITARDNIPGDYTPVAITLSSMVNLNEDLILLWNEQKVGYSYSAISIYKYSDSSYLSSSYRYYANDPTDISPGKLGIINDKIYHVWSEAKATPPPISDQLRARLYIGKDNNEGQFIDWEMIDGNNTHGLNYIETQRVFGELDTVVFNNKIYVAFREYDGTVWRWHLRVKVGE